MGGPGGGDSGGEGDDGIHIYLFIKRIEFRPISANAQKWKALENNRKLDPNVLPIQFQSNFCFNVSATVLALCPIPYDELFIWIGYSVTKSNFLTTIRRRNTELHISNDIIYYGYHLSKVVEFKNLENSEMNFD